MFHVLNRGVGRQELFADDGDYAAFERVLAESLERVPVSLLAYCLMPNHWHLVLRPQKDRQLGAFMQLLATTHVRRWQEHRRRVGWGHVYQGRFKSFPIQQDEHFLTACRYVERNALRATWCGGRRTGGESASVVQPVAAGEGLAAGAGDPGRVAAAGACRLAGAGEPAAEQGRGGGAAGERGAGQAVRGGGVAAAGGAAAGPAVQPAPQRQAPQAAAEDGEAGEGDEGPGEDVRAAGAPPGGTTDSKPRMSRFLST